MYTGHRKRKNGNYGSLSSSSKKKESSSQDITIVETETENGSFRVRSNESSSSLSRPKKREKNDQDTKDGDNPEERFLSIEVSESKNTAKSFPSESDRSTRDSDRKRPPSIEPSQEEEERFKPTPRATKGLRSPPSCFSIEEASIQPSQKSYQPQKQKQWIEFKDYRPMSFRWHGSNHTPQFLKSKKGAVEKEANVLEHQSSLASYAMSAEELLRQTTERRQKKTKNLLDTATTRSTTSGIIKKDNSATPSASAYSKDNNNGIGTTSSTAAINRGLPPLMRTGTSSFPSSFPIFSISQGSSITPSGGESIQNRYTPLSASTLDVFAKEQNSAMCICAQKGVACNCAQQKEQTMLKPAPQSCQTIAEEPQEQQKPPQGQQKDEGSSLVGSALYSAIELQVAPSADSDVFSRIEEPKFPLINVIEEEAEVEANASAQELQLAPTDVSADDEAASDVFNKLERGSPQNQQEQHMQCDSNEEDVVEEARPGPDGVEVSFSSYSCEDPDSKPGLLQKPKRVRGRHVRFHVQSATQKREEIKFESEFLNETYSGSYSGASDNRAGELRRVMLSFCIFLFVILSVATGLVFYLRSKNHQDSELTKAIVTSKNKDFYEFELDQLPNQTIVSILSDPQSPQAQALTWVKSDPAFDTYYAHQIEQKLALATLYYATNGSSWANSDHWLNYSVHECDWFSTATFYGNQTVCHEDGETYKSLVLSTNLLQGSIPAEVALLSSLENLNLAGNRITGSLPEQFSTELTELRTFNVFHNKMTGSIPVGNFTKLFEMQVHSNSFSSSIPTEIGLMTNLKTLDWSMNQLTGVIPSSIGQLARLENLRLDWNLLSGIIPTELGMCNELRNLVLSDNSLVGPLPGQLGQLQELEKFYAYKNKLGGPIPTEISKMKNLKVLNLIRNNLGGSLPPEIGDLSKLQLLHLSNNVFSSTIPIELGRLSSLVYLYLDGNAFSGEVPASIGQLSMLEKLNLNTNALTGEFPFSAMSYLTHLTYIDLDNNTFVGNLASEVGLLDKLESLSINFNYLEGAIPSEVGNLVWLRKLALSSNMLNGPIPPEFGWLLRMNDLLLSDNMLTATMPMQLGQLWELEVLDVSRNRMTGAIPPEIGILSQRLKSLFVELNMFESLPSEIGLLTHLEYFSGWENAFAGPIPNEIGALSQMKVFDMCMNPKLVGTIPEGIANWNNVEEVWLSATDLSGPVPAGLSELNSLAKLYLEDTKLSGTLASNLCSLDGLQFTCSNRLCGCDCDCPYKI